MREVRLKEVFVISLEWGLREKRSHKRFPTTELRDETWEFSPKEWCGSAFSLLLALGTTIFSLAESTCWSCDLGQSDKSEKVK